MLDFLYDSCMFTYVYWVRADYMGWAWICRLGLETCMLGWALSYIVYDILGNSMSFVLCLLFTCYKYFQFEREELGMIALHTPKFILHYLSDLSLIFWGYITILWLSFYSNDWIWAWLIKNIIFTDYFRVDTNDHFPKSLIG